MVKYIYLILFILSISISTAQRINIGIDMGMFTLANTKTLFEEKPFYYLYAAPFSEIGIEEQSPSYQDYIQYGQVRLVRIWGISPNLDSKIKIGGNINYKSKNNFIAKFSFNIFNVSDNVYYSFQPLMINMEDNYFNNDLNILDFDNAIIVSRYINKYLLTLLYKVPIKYKIKPFVLAGFAERIQIYSNYSSTTMNCTYDENDNYKYNIEKFEENLYEQLKYDGFSHYVNIGFGFVLHSFSISTSWNTTIGNANSEYYISQNFIVINLSYDLVSIPLFK